MDKCSIILVLKEVYLTLNGVNEENKKILSNIISENNIISTFTSDTIDEMAIIYSQDIELINLPFSKRIVAQMKWGQVRTRLNNKDADILLLHDFLDNEGYIDLFGKNKNYFEHTIFLNENEILIRRPIIENLILG